MNLYFQVLTQTQSATALELLRFPSIFNRAPQLKGKGKVSAGGKISSFKFSSSEELITKAGRKKFNELEAQYSSAAFDLGLTGCAVLSVRGVFKPAASGDLWFFSREWPPGGDRSARDRKMNAKAAELGLDYYKVKQKPCLLEVVFEVATAKSEGEILDRVAERLVAQMAEALRQTEPFGCCDVGGVEFSVRFESNFVTTEKIRIMANLRPPAYPQLGLRFDQLHPLMFGNRELCRDIAQALGSDAKLILGNGEESPAVVRLRPECDLTAASKRASNWLLIQ